MYQADGIKTVLDTEKRGSLKAVGPTAVLLGITSMLTDISSEMVSAILPLYLVFGVGLSPFAFGAVDGLYQGVTAIVRLASGFVSDRWEQHKRVATAGYTLSALARLGVLAAGSTTPFILTLVVLDRIGKGIRTGPRDALIALTAPEGRLGFAFGVHRALDTFGAMLGPLIAFGLLAIAPGSYDAVFVISFCFAVVGVAVLVLFVKNATAAMSSERATSLRAALALVRRPQVAKITLVVTALGLTTISDAFVYLALQKHLDFEAGLLPLLYVGTAAAFAVLAVPFGRLADRVGRTKVFFAGYALLPLVYSSLLIDIDSTAVVAVYLLVLGAFYAATDGVLMARVGPLLPQELSASGLSLVSTASAVAKLVASVAFGALWTFAGLTSAVLVFGAGLVIVLVVAGAVLRRDTNRGAHG